MLERLQSTLKYGLPITNKPSLSLPLNDPVGDFATCDLEHLTLLQGNLELLLNGRFTVYMVLNDWWEEGNHLFFHFFHQAVDDRGGEYPHIL
jgi:hypothetical protein